MNFKIILSGLMALMLGLGMSGCATASTPDGYATRGIIAGADLGAKGGMALVTGINDLSNDLFTSIERTNLTKNQMLESKAFEVVYQDKNVSIFTHKDDKYYFYILSNNHSSPAIKTTGKHIAKEKKEIESSYNIKLPALYSIVAINTNEKKLGKVMDSDRFGNPIWLYDDLILYLDIRTFKGNSVLYYFRDAREGYNPYSTARWDSKPTVSF